MLACNPLPTSYPALTLLTFWVTFCVTFHLTNTRDGDIFQLESNPTCSLRVVHTPGHTPDSVIFYDQRHDVAFVGDTIFKGSRGNDQYPGGDGRQLLRSIREMVLTLPDQTALLSGHSEETTVGAEKRYY